MKKFVIALSLVLIVSMLCAIPAFGVNVSDYDIGQTVHYVGAVTDKAPNVTDAVISEGEYTSTYDGSIVAYTDANYAIVTNGTTVNRKMPVGQPQKLMDSEVMKFHFAQTATHYYVGIEHWAGHTDKYYIGRSNLIMQVGFDGEKTLNLTHYGNGGYASGVRNSTEDAQGNNFACTFGTAIEEMYVQKYTESVVGSGNYDVLYLGTTDTYCYNGAANGWTTRPQKVTYEIKLNKAELANKLGYANANALPAEMFFKVITDGRTVTNDVSQIDFDKIFTYRTGIVAKEDTGNFTKGQYVPDILIFSADPNATTEPETTAPVTEPIADVTEDVQTNVPVDSGAESTEPTTAGGCGASVSLAGMALVAILGTAATVIEKKRR